VQDGLVNFMKAGILRAHRLSTVSPTYAREIQTEDYGFGLHDLLRARRADLVGILNGIDTDVWDPRTDPHAPHFSEKSLHRKELAKQVLLSSLGLSYEKGVPVFGIVTRLSKQKGIELLYDAIPELLATRDVRFVALGSGQSDYEGFLQSVQDRFPGKACYWRGFNDPLAHLIEAGSDFFLMPSLYEPCGLNQMYSQRYGTAPIVRKTGGLADSVEQFRASTGEGTGFVFDHPTSQGMRWAIGQALETYADKHAWRRLQLNGMAKDFSWDASGARYVALYDSMRRGQAVPEAAAADRN
jgi:starch synthase